MNQLPIGLTAEKLEALARLAHTCYWHEDYWDRTSPEARGLWPIVVIAVLNAASDSATPDYAGIARDALHTFLTTVVICEKRKTLCGDDPALWCDKCSIPYYLDDKGEKNGGSI